MPASVASGARQASGACRRVLYSRPVADLPIPFIADGLADRLAGALDAEEKIPRAFDSLFPLAGRDVALLDGGRGLRARQLIGLGACLTVVAAEADRASLITALEGLEPAAHVVPGSSVATGLPDSSQDAVIVCWSAFEGPSAPELAEVDRILRPGGRLLVLQDYGRDDVSFLRPDQQARQVLWSRRDGPFLSAGFRVRVIHCWWTFHSIEEAGEFLVRGFPETGPALAARLRRPRLSYNVAIYHRDRP